MARRDTSLGTSINASVITVLRDRQPLFSGPILLQL
jgi:hypothetical protein